VAVILPDDELLTKAAGKNLSFPELAALKQRALAGDASAAVALEYLPVGARRNAELLVEHFTVTKSAKPEKVKKSARPKLTKSQRRELDAVLNARPDPLEPDFFALKRAFRNHPDPAMREMARKARL
jgi:hypothetical protein